MKTFYKVFLVLLFIFSAINLYAIRWDLSLFHDENLKYSLSLFAGMIGILLVFVMNTWSKVGVKK